MFNLFKKTSSMTNSHNALATRTQQEMLDVLMDPKSSGPEIHYYMIRGGENKKNITVWEPGTVGNEFIKSYGHYHVLDFDERYEILAGEGIVIMQIRSIDPITQKPIDEELTSFRAIKVKPGDKVDIPRRAGHLMINTGDTWLVTRDNSPVIFTDEDPVSHPSHADYAPFKKMHGAGYYVTKENSEIKLIKNTNYSKLPEAHIE